MNTFTNILLTQIGTFGLLLKELSLPGNYAEVQGSTDAEQAEEEEEPAGVAGVQGSRGVAVVQEYMTGRHQDTGIAHAGTGGDRARTGCNGCC